MNAGNVRPSSRRRVLVGASALAVAIGCLTPSHAAAGKAPAPDDDDRDVRVVVVGDDGKVVRVGSDDPDKKGAYLGVSLGENTDLSEGGAKVESVVEGSPADAAGIHRGDTVVGFGSTVIRGPAKLSEQIHAAEPGERVEVKLIRKDGKKETVTVELGERPSRSAHGFWFGTGGDEDVAPLPELEGLHEGLKNLGRDLKVRSFRLPRGLGGLDRPRLGVELVETTPELREFLGAGRDAGVIVGKVLAGTPAEKAGVRVGDVIVAVDGTAIKDAGDLIDQLSEKEGSSISLELIRDRRTVRLSVPIPKQDDESDEPAGPRASQVGERELQTAEQAMRRAELAARLDRARQLSQQRRVEYQRQADQWRVAAQEAARKAQADARRLAREARAREPLRNAI